ncbi:MAG: ComF family protein [Steroidobacteraceae bacterium]
MAFWLTIIHGLRPISPLRHGMDLALAAWLFPPICVICRRRAIHPWLDLCDACLQILPLQPLAQAGTPLIAALGYAFPADHWVRRLKFNSDRVAGRLLGTLLAGSVLAAGDRLPDALVPVPLHPRRLAERGYNQSLLIARQCALLLDRPVRPHWLRRVTHSPAQTRLAARERLHNVAGAFAAAGSVRGKTLALVDDVHTTGATASACTQALLGAGAASVRTWTACRS